MRIPSQAYNALLLRIPSAETKLGAASTEFPNSALTIPAPKKREDYPNVRFWFTHEWTEYLNEHGTDRDAPHGKIKGVNVTMRYVETVNGEIIDGNRATDMRRFTRATWVWIGNQGVPPATWGSADIKTKELYCREMRGLFEELSLCDLDWKAEQIATDNYPSWRANWTKQQGKKQSSSLEVPASESKPQVKRACCESTKPASKKQKLDDVTAMDSAERDDTTMTKGNPQVCSSVGSWTCRPLTIAQVGAFLAPNLVPLVSSQGSDPELSPRLHLLTEISQNPAEPLVNSLKDSQVKMRL